MIFYLVNHIINFIKGHCDCGAQQQQWFLFDPLHAYAEYIIEYEYLFSVRSLTWVLNKSNICIS